MLKKCNFCFILLVIVFTLACKEESDIQSPKIIIEKPNEGAQYAVGENIHVKAIISDNEIVESVEVRLNKLSDNAKVGESLFFNVGSSTYNLDTYYHLKDTLLLSDDYYITISAFDGNQEGKAFQKLKISGLAKRKLSDVIIVSNGIQCDLIELKNKTIKNTIYNFSSDYGGAAFSSKYQMIYLCGKFDNKLFGFDIKSYTNSWVKTYPSTTSSVTFNNLSIDAFETNIGVSLTAGYTDVINPYGSEIRNFQPNIGMIPQSHFMEERVTFIETFSLNNSVHKMESFYSSTAAPFDSRNINFQLVNVFEEEERKAYIFSNLSGASILYEYTYSSKNIRTADNLTNDSLISVIQIDKDIFLIAGNNHVYKYFLTHGSLIELLSGVKAEVMEYDQLNGEIYIGNGNTLSVYDYSSGNLKSTISFPMEIKNIFFRYNISTN